MAFFSENSQQLILKVSDGPNSGLRLGQVGALHAIAGHFIEREEPAIVSLPTGYGKTAVLTASGFLLCAKRILVVTPTNSLRVQTFRAFRTLETLRRLSVLPPENRLPNPRVVAVTKRITTVDGWNALAQYDVIVCTPSTASPEYEDVPEPPKGLFDLVIVDEGHHSPAKTWSTLIRATNGARHLLLSATPYRRDNRQIPGKMIFYYSLKRAVAENAFGKIKFQAVLVDEHATRDVREDALIAATVSTYRRDAAAGHQHRLLARIDKISDAERLAIKYGNAGLRVACVSSNKSRKQISEVEASLTAGELDGVICVDMFGEGYDFPKFKIAALHSTHRSLVPTLQFIGRFARTNDEHTGDATFLAIPSLVSSESEILYRDGVDWDVLLVDLAEERQQIGIREREELQAFAESRRPSADYESVNPASIKIAQHLAVYRVENVPDFTQLPDMIMSMQLTNAWTNEASDTCLLLAKLTRSPVWYRSEHIVDASHECILIKYFPTTKLLFISSTERSARCYFELLKFFVNGAAVSLSFDRIRNVLNGMTDQEFFSIGIRSISPSATTESYRIVAGSNADRGLRESDASNFAQGHFMGRGQVNNESEIIGASAGGRVWSNGKLTIANAISWMSEIHNRITAPRVNIGRSGLDILTYGENLQRVPESTCMADWPKNGYRDNPRILIGDNQNLRSTCLLDLSILDIVVSQNGMSLTFSVGDELSRKNFRYNLNQIPQFVSDEQDLHLLVAPVSGDELPIEYWLEDNGLTFYTRELDSFSHGNIVRRRNGAILKPGSIVPRPWDGCEIDVEFDQKNPDRMTVQRYLQEQLIGIPNVSFIIFDHRSGEAADFIVGEKLPENRLSLSLYHCKAAGGPVSGQRVEDVYELACQAVKSVRYQRKDDLLRHIERRTTVKANGGYSRFIVGDRDAALQLIKDHDPISISMTVYSVQPGLSAGDLSEGVRLIIAASNDSITTQGVEARWLVSQ